MSNTRLTQNAASGAALLWSIDFPKRGSAVTSRTRPRATLRISSETYDDESILVPLAVGKALQAKLKRADATPSTREEILETLSKAERACIQLRLESLINRREYTEKELADKLRLDGYPTKLVTKVLNRAVEVGAVSNSRYAGAFTRTKLSAGWGLARIQRELLRKGIEVDQIDGWPDDFVDGESEFDRAIRVVQRKNFSGKNPFGKAVRFLLGRGYSTSVSMDVAYRLKEDGKFEP